MIVSVNLDDYAELVDELSPESRAVLRSTWMEATKIYSPRGLDN